MTQKCPTQVQQEAAGEGADAVTPSHLTESRWQARCAVLSLLATFLLHSPQASTAACLAACESLMDLGCLMTWHGNTAWPQLCQASVRAAKAIAAVWEFCLRVSYQHAGLLANMLDACQQDGMLISGLSRRIVCHMLHPASSNACMLFVERALSLQVQRRAVRDWDIVKSLFGLVWEPHTQLPALRMVTPHMHQDLCSAHLPAEIQP